MGCGSSVCAAGVEGPLALAPADWLEGFAAKGELVQLAPVLEHCEALGVRAIGDLRHAMPQEVTHLRAQLRPAARAKLDEALMVLAQQIGKMYDKAAWATLASEAELQEAERNEAALAEEGAGAALLRGPLSSTQPPNA